jgi:hypothetical protein
MHRSHRIPQSAATLLGTISLKLLRLGWLYCCLGVLRAIAEVPRYLPRVLWRVAVLGATLSLVFELVLRVPDFPFWSAMQTPIASLVLLALHRALVLVTKPAPR